MEEDYTSLPTSHLLGSVPAVAAEDKTGGAARESSTANLQNSPPANGGYQAPGSPYGGDEQATSSWKGACSISSYTPYFNVDSDIVVDRLITSVYPMNDFTRKIDGNPDLYGPVWISTTLVFMLAALGNCATYLMRKRNEPDIVWNFDVTYVDWAACVIYGYALAVPVAFYFLLQYVGCNASLIRLWCMWGYSLFIFLPSSLLLVAPVEIVRWIVIILAGAASSWFVALNLKAYTDGSDLMVLIVSALLLQFALALFIKIFFFV
ncbi:protein YIPF1 homolog [Phoenix dactylifera]|uniref:Protein YIP n=1 Tax=Phoenix dactylifera TaxID=42345 RepID=A0A8B9AYD8_PHODC|nr:protein YIPF1 homolog [Phoenix dactylifera]XP_038988430.1 protein YIPF1 homolog [Phoenix dactylifera]